MDEKGQDKRLAKGEQMRQAILETAIEIIGSNGIEHVSAAKIASAIGTSKSNVFHHFKTREAILLGVHDYIYEGFKSSFVSSASSLKAYLTGLGDALFDTQEDMIVYKAFYAFYNEGLFNPVFSERLTASTSHLLKSIEQELTRICAEQGIKGSDLNERIKIVSHGILCFLDGAGLHFMLNPELTYLKESWKLQVRLWKKYLKGL
ncbi:MAG TPA: hypothetical protein DCS67_12735 [Clostridiales bacterium UBA8960]|nr:hypothetical protein [Clostridiales bacterium UBA8960]